MKRTFPPTLFLLLVAILAVAGCETVPVPAPKPAPAPTAPPAAPAVVTPVSPTPVAAVVEQPPPPAPAAITAADFPPEPDYKTLAKAFLKKILKDPDSAIYEAWTIAKAYRDGTPPMLGWQVFVSVNSKDLRGKYTGTKSYNLWVSGDRVENALFLGNKIHVVDAAGTAKSPK